MAYADYDGRVTCLWDARRHSALVIDDVRTLHDTLIEAHTGGGSTAVRLYFPYQLTHRRPPHLAA